MVQLGKSRRAIRLPLYAGRTRTDRKVAGRYGQKSRARAKPTGEKEDSGSDQQPLQGASSGERHRSQTSVEDQKQSGSRDIGICLSGANTVAFGLLNTFPIARNDVSG